MLVLYGSETGNAQDVAGMLTAYMKQALTDCCALPMDCVTLDELASEEHVIYVCSTTGRMRPQSSNYSLSRLWTEHQCGQTMTW